MKCKFTAISFKTGLKSKNEQLTALGKMIWMHLLSADALSKDLHLQKKNVLAAQIVNDAKSSQDVLKIALGKNTPQEY